MAERIPISQHKLRGTYRRDRHGIGAEFQPDGAPIKPDGLSAAAERFWSQHIDPLIVAGVVGETDQATCESAAHWYVELVRCQQAQSAAAPSSDAYYRLATLTAVAQKQFNTLAQSLGLSPYHRRRVRTASGAQSSLIAKRARYIKTTDDVAAKFFIDDKDAT